MKIKAGTQLTLSHGVCSSYSFTGPFTVLRDFDQAEAAEAFVKSWRGGDELFGSEAPRISSFITWLLLKKYITNTPGALEWFLGGTGFDPALH